MESSRRAVVASALGGPEVLQVVEVPVTEPGPGEVRLRVHAAGVNPWDWKSYAPGSGAHPPVRLGLEVSGVVEETGTGVRWFSEGDEVVAWPVRGGYADVVTVPQRVLVRRPDRLDPVAAAGLLAAGAATRAIYGRRRRSIKKGEKHLVGGVRTKVAQSVFHNVTHETL